MAFNPYIPGVYFTSQAEKLLAVPLAETPKGFFPIFSPMGVDNKPWLIETRNDLIQAYGDVKEKYDSYGLQYCMPHVLAQRALGYLPQFIMRLLPDDAQHANVAISVAKRTGENELVYVYEQLNLTSIDELNSEFWNRATPTGYDIFIPLFVVYGEGRGVWYNDLRFRVSKIHGRHWVYGLDLEHYNSKSDAWELVSSVNFSTDRNVSDTGSNIYIKEVIDNQVPYIRVEINPNMIREEIMEIILSQIQLASIEVVDMGNIPPDTTNLADGSKYFILEKASGDWTGESGKLATWDATNGQWIFDDVQVDTIIYNQKDQKYYVYEGMGIVDLFDIYMYGLVTDTGTEIYDPEGTNTYKELGNGYDGSLFDQNGKIVPSVANELLKKAYLCEIYPDLKNDAVFDFYAIFDAGYAKEVKYAMRDMVATVRPSSIMAYMDNGLTFNVDQDLNNADVEYPFTDKEIKMIGPWVKAYISELEVTADAVTPNYAYVDMEMRNVSNTKEYHSTLGTGLATSKEIIPLYYATDEQLEDLKTAKINPFRNVPNYGPTLLDNLTKHIIDDGFQFEHIVKLDHWLRRALRPIAFSHINGEMITEKKLDALRKDVMNLLSSVDIIESIDKVDVYSEGIDKQRGVVRVKIELTIKQYVKSIVFDLTYSL